MFLPSLKYIYCIYLLLKLYRLFTFICSSYVIECSLFSMCRYIYLIHYMNIGVIRLLHSNRYVDFKLDNDCCYVLSIIMYKCKSLDDNLP